MVRYIFVYGTLMKGFENYKRYLQGKVKSRELARVRGSLYHLIDRGYPALISGSDYVCGELITIKDFPETIIQLDKLESYYGKDNPENEYNRILKNVEIIETGHVVQAHVYQYNCQNINERNDYIFEGDWREYLEKIS